MSYLIDTYDEHNPVMRITTGDREITFSVARVQPDAHEWLGEVLDRQINEMIDRRVREALAAHKKQLRDLIGAA
jgi:L-arabinose isomerase